MPYRELPPPPGLERQIACLWLRTPAPEPRTSRVLPDACVDVVAIPGERFAVAGPATGPMLAELPAGTPVLGVRFRVAAAGPALRLPAAELLDDSVPLEELWGREAERVHELVLAADDPEAQLAVLTSAVAERLPPTAGDPLVRAAALGLADPHASVAGLGARLGIGERQLRRRFSEAVGYGPKTLQRVLRFQRFLGLARDGRRADLARLALDAGYADQAHLTRECGRLSGLPPALLLASGAGPAGERSDSFKTPAPAPATIAA